VHGAVCAEHAPGAAHLAAQLTGVATVHHVARLHVLKHVTLLLAIVAAINALPANVQLDGARNKTMRFADSKTNLTITTRDRLLFS
jgi:hypothetical protein